MIVFVILLAALATLLALSIHRQCEWQTFPSVLWCALMVVPILCVEGFNSGVIGRQMLGVAAIAGTLLVGDSLGVLTYKKYNFTIPKVPHAPPSWMPLLLLSLLFIGVLGHLILMESVPVLAYLQQSVSAADIAVLREKSSKLLDVPRPLMWYFNYITLVFAPLALWCLARERQWFAFAGTTAVTIFYSVATTSKLPALLLLSSLAVMLYCKLRRSIPNYVVSLTVLSAALSVIAMVHSHKSHVMTLHSPEIARLKLLMPEQAFTDADYYRTARYDQSERDGSEFERKAHYFVYRCLLTPIDVAHRWYSYFPDKEGGYLGFKSTTSTYGNAEKLTSPANAVGLWAYASRFPAKYLSSVSAYASVDADAMARGGFLFLAVTVAILLFVRVLLIVLERRYYGIGALVAVPLLYLGVLLPSASLQAILISHGVLLYIAILFLIGELYFGKQPTSASECGSKTPSAIPKACANRADD